MSLDPVLQALDQHRQTLEAARRLFVGFSGGLDSTVLLHAMAQRQPAVIALHANHGLQGQAAQWDEACAARCRDWSLAFKSRSLEVRDRGEGLESAARDARYRWFESVLHGGDLLLLAHHQDDQAETFMLRLLRGAGPDGLAAMPRQRRLGEASLLRPFLDLPRRVLEDYAQRHSLSWIEDPSNAQAGFDRNYLRHEIMPRLEQRWPGYRKTLARSASQLAEWLEHGSGPPLETVQGALGDPGFPVAALPEVPAAAALALRGWLQRRGLAVPPAARLREFLRQLREGQGATLATSTWILERYRDAVFCRAPDPVPPQACALHPGESVRWGELGTLTVRAGGAPGLHDLHLRTRRGGERLLTGAGQHKDLKHLFQEHGVPPWWRDRLPLLFLRSGAGEELLAVGAIASSPQAEALGLELVWQRAKFATK